MKSTFNLSKYLTVIDGLIVLGGISTHTQMQFWVLLLGWLLYTNIFINTPKTYDASDYTLKILSFCYLLSYLFLLTYLGKHLFFQ